MCVVRLQMFKFILVIVFLRILTIWQRIRLLTKETHLYPIFAHAYAHTLHTHSSGDRRLLLENKTAQQIFLKI